MGENIRTEDFGFEAQKYITDMIIVAPQLNDWGQTSADKTIELTQYFLTHYIINPSKVYINGYSGGGETLSLVLAKQPELSESEIDKLVVLDVKDKDYFEETPVTYQHGGGYLFCRDKEIMGWLFNQ